MVGLKSLFWDFGAYFAREPLKWRLEEDGGELRSSRKRGENGVTPLVCLEEFLPSRREDEELIPRLPAVVLLAAELSMVESRPCSSWLSRSCGLSGPEPKGGRQLPLNLLLAAESGAPAKLGVPEIDTRAENYCGGVELASLPRGSLRCWLSYAAVICACERGIWSA